MTIRTAMALTIALTAGASTAGVVSSTGQLMLGQFQAGQHGPGQSVGNLGPGGVAATLTKHRGFGGVIQSSSERVTADGMTPGYRGVVPSPGTALLAALGVLLMATRRR